VGARFDIWRNMKRELKNYVSRFKALGDRTRLRIVMMLRAKPLCVCEIREIIGTSMSTVSNHLKILSQAGIIRFTKEERFINYELNRGDPIVHEIIKFLEGLQDEEIESDREKALRANRLEIC